jgi:hypothetical protein
MIKKIKKFLEATKQNKKLFQKSVKILVKKSKKDEEVFKINLEKELAKERKILDRNFDKRTKAITCEEKKETATAKEKLKKNCTDKMDQAAEFMVTEFTNLI